MIFCGIWSYQEILSISFDKLCWDFLSVNSKNDGSGYPTITVKIDGGAPFDIEFDDYDEIDDHGYTKAIWLMGTDEGGGEWGMEGSMAFHGDIEDFDIDTLEKDETKRN